MKSTTIKRTEHHLPSHTTKHTIIDSVVVLQFLDFSAYTMAQYLSMVIAINVKHVACSVT